MTSLARSFSRTSRSFRSDVPMTMEQLQYYAPSVFAEEKHATRSANYAYVSTSDLIQGLQKEAGLAVFMVCQGGTRDETRQGFTKHFVRMRKPGDIAKPEAYEVILLNSHDGTSSYQMFGGVIRFVCQNSMILGDNFTEVRIPHKGDITGRVIEGAYEIIQASDKVTNNIDDMKMLTLNRDEQILFAQSALLARYTSEETAPIDADKLLLPERQADAGNDLWRVFNRTQEHLTQGGLVGRNAAGRRTTTRAITGIDNAIKTNRALWNLAEGMRRLKIGESIDGLVDIH